MIVHPWFYAVAIPAVILIGLSKGGLAGISALALPLLALQISPLRGAVIMLPILMIQDVVSVWAYWRKWDWANLKIMLPGALAGIAAGYLSPPMFRTPLSSWRSALFRWCSARATCCRRRLRSPSRPMRKRVYSGGDVGFHQHDR